MCTVTFIPKGDEVFISSNRDEKILRKAALHPDVQHFSSGKILFPKDGEKGGTWIGAHSNGNVMVLLNGAFEAHVPATNYEKSRGLVFLDIFNTGNPVQAFDNISLYNIEPFTLVSWQGKSGVLCEMRWDGTDKYIIEKDNSIPQIWSSATLYDSAVRHKREQWFNDWLSKTTEIDVPSISCFHEFGGEGDKAIDLHMSRNGVLETVSITVIEWSREKQTMHYKDMLTGMRSVNEWLRGANDSEV